MTEKQVRTYYKDKPTKPQYFIIQNDSVSLFCSTTGADTLPPLLLIHGAPGAWYAERGMLGDTTLQKHFHIISMDRLGYNHSVFKNKKRAVVSIQTQAVALLEALQLNRSKQKGIVLGSSYGAPIALKMAVLNPQKFHHVILLAGAVEPNLEKFWWFSRLIRYGPLRWLMPRFINHATDEKFAHIGELKKLLPSWKKLSTPITMVQGGKDDIVHPANLDFAKKQLLNKPANFIFLPEASHFLRWRHPELIKQIIITPFNNTNSKSAMPD